MVWPTVERMSRRLPSRSLLAVAVVSLVLLSGCGAVTDAIMGAATDAITEQADEMYEEAPDYTADVTVEVTEDGETTTYEGTVYAKPGQDWHRVEFDEAGAVSGVVCIQKGDETTVYDDAGEVVEERTGSCFETDLPRYTVLAAAFEGEYNATITGAEQFENGSANVLELTPATDEAPTGDLTVWLTAERFVPVYRQATVSTADGTKTVTVTYENLETGNVSDSRFEE